VAETHPHPGASGITERKRPAMKPSYQSLEPQNITITSSMKEIRRKQPKARSDIHPSLLSTTRFAVLYSSTPLIDFELGYIPLEKDTVLLE